MKQKNNGKKLNQYCFFGKINKMDRSLTKLTKRKREKRQIIKIRNKTKNITTNFAEIKSYKIY